MLHIVLWKWHQAGFREAYTHEHVNRLAVDLQKNLVGVDHRIVLVTDDAAMVDLSVDTFPLWKDHNTVENVSGKHLPSCYRRLRLFDPETQLAMGIKQDDRIMSLDLDTLVVGDMKNIVARKERFVGWAVRGTRHARVFNGSMFMFTQGDFEELWRDFDPQVSPKAASNAGFFGSDQGWLSYKLARRSECAGWSYPFVVSYPREVMRRPALPRNCSVVFFHGRKKPWHVETQRETPWVKQFWRMNDAVQVEQGPTAVSAPVAPRRGPELVPRGLQRFHARQVGRA